MKKGQNPLYPESEEKGLMGAYEEAALMDDNNATFGRNSGGFGRKYVVFGMGGEAFGGNDEAFGKKAARRRSKVASREADLEFAQSMKRARRELDAEVDETMANYHRELKILRRRKRAGEISRVQFHKLKRQLVRKTDAKNWASWKRFWMR